MDNNSGPDSGDDDKRQRDDLMTSLLFQAALKSSILSSSTKESDEQFGKVPKPVNGSIIEEKGGNAALRENLPYESDASWDDSGSSSVFEMGEKNLFLCVRQGSKLVIPPPVSPKNFFKSIVDGRSSKARALVVIVRDLQRDVTNSRFSLSRALKEKLKTYRIKSYVISIPTLMKDLQVIQLMKAFAKKIATSDEKLSLADGFSDLVFAVLAEKMAAKKRKVIIIDLGDETTLRLWPVRDFCVRSQAEVLTLDRLPTVPFEPKLAKVSREIYDRYKEFDWNFIERKEVTTYVSNSDLLATSDLSDAHTAITKNDDHRETNSGSPPRHTESHKSTNVDNNENPAIENEDMDLRECLNRRRRLIGGESASDLASDAVEEDNNSNNNVADTPQSSSGRQIEPRPRYTESYIAELVDNIIKSRGIDVRSITKNKKIRDRAVPELTESLSGEGSTDTSGEDNSVSCISSVKNKPTKKKSNKTNVIKTSSHNSAGSKAKQRSLYALRRNVPESNSSDTSTNVKELFSQRPQLIRIQKISDSHAPSATFSQRHDLSKQPSRLDEEYLHKGWIAIPQNPPRKVVGVEKWLRNTGISIMIVLRCLGSFFTCRKYCRPTPVVPQSQSPYRHNGRRHYRPGIKIESDENIL